MELHYQDDWLTVYQGDARAVLDTLPEQSVHATITSPPYFGLRSYLDAGNESKALEIGREQTPQEYVDALVDVFRSVRRVLRDDGTLWLNLGDSYAAQRGGTAMPAETMSGGEHGFGPEESKRGRGDSYQPHRDASKIGYKHKDLMGMPWRVAFALQADGWYLRNDIVWNVVNPMPESVKDRFTSSHEFVFLFAKNPTYFFDQDSVREPHTEVTLNRIRYGLKHKHPDGIGVSIPPVDTDEMGERFAHAGGRNKRDVWTIPTVPYAGAHYAVFPPALVEPCVRAGTSERGVCAECGAPWRRVTERAAERERRAVSNGIAPENASGGTRAKAAAGSGGGNVLASVERRQMGWEPTCAHRSTTVPSVVLDCFAGSGTVGKVAQSLSRRAVLIDLNVDYLEQQMERNANLPLGLSFESTEA